MPSTPLAVSLARSASLGARAVTAACLVAPANLTRYDAIDGLLTRAEHGGLAIRFTRSISGKPRS